MNRTEIYADHKDPRRPERYVGTEEAAAFLDKPKSWLHNNAARLGIPRYRVGNHFRWRLSELAQWVERTGAVR